MTIKELSIKGVLEIQLEAKEDSRGFFMRTYDDKVFNAHGINKNWVQEYQSFSKEKGVIRGIHLQLEPFAETKLIRVVSGEIFDVFVDLRKGSETFGKWGSNLISAKNKKIICIPRGFGHAFCTLAENTHVICKMDNYYSFESERQVKWNDPDLGIIWPLEGVPVISEKDANAKGLKEFIKTCI